MQIKAQGYPVQVDANKNRYYSELSKSGYFRETRTLNFKSYSYEKKYFIFVGTGFDISDIM